MADVFYALAPAGRPVAVKLLRPASGAAEVCQREHNLASAVDARCTAPALGHGRSTAGACLVTAHLPGYRCRSTLVGGPTPASRLWSLGAALAHRRWRPPLASRSELEWIMRVQSAPPAQRG